MAKTLEQIKAKHEAEIKAFERQSVLEACLQVMGIPVPDSYCAHKNWTSLWYSRKDYKKFTKEEVLAMLKEWRGIVVPMQYGSDKTFGTYYPPAAHGNEERYEYEPKTYEVALHQALFGESVYDKLPTNTVYKVEWWAMIGERLLQVTMEIDSIPAEYRCYVRYAGRHSFHKTAPEIPGAKKVSYGGGSPNGMDVRYLFTNVQGLADALTKETKTDG